MRTFAALAVTLACAGCGGGYGWGMPTSALGAQFGPRPVTALDTYRTQAPRMSVDEIIAEAREVASGDDMHRIRSDAYDMAMARALARMPPSPLPDAEPMQVADVAVTSAGLSLASYEDDSPARADRDASFACSGGSTLRVTYAADRDSVTASWNGDDPITLERDGTSEGPTYVADAAMFQRAGPRASWSAAGTVTVARGDTLSLIAERVYGSVDRWEEIARANADRVEDPNLIFPGQTLVLPGMTHACRVSLAAQAG